MKEKITIFWGRSKSTILSLLITFIIASAVTTFWFRLVVVNGDSMNPTLENGDIGISFIVHENTKINRNDIVAIKVNTDDNKEKFIIKRVIGLPGEHMVSDGENITIDGQPIQQDYLAEGTYTDPFDIQLGDDEYYVLGDNRENSRDSREYGIFHHEDFLTHGAVMLP